jgi:hypothetical protein
VITSEELAAIAAALALLNQSEESKAAPTRVSRWKLAAREPDLEIEDLRVH